MADGSGLVKRMFIDLCPGYLAILMSLTGNGYQVSVRNLWLEREVTVNSVAYIKNGPFSPFIF